MKVVWWFLFNGSSLIDNKFNLLFFSSFHCHFFCCSSWLNTLQHSLFFSSSSSSIVLLVRFISLHVLKKKKLREGICRVASFSTPSLHLKWSYTTSRNKKNPTINFVDLLVHINGRLHVGTKEAFFRGHIGRNEMKMLNQFDLIIFVWSLVFLRNHNCKFFFSLEWKGESDFSFLILSFRTDEENFILL